MNQNFSLLSSYDHAALTAREKLHEFHKAAQHKKDAGETPAPVKTEYGLFQNEGHVRALRRVLAEFEPLDIIPIVAFSGTADIKMDIKESHVVYWSQLRRCIRRYNKERHTWKEVKAICNRIYEVKLKPSRRTQRRHMTGVRSAQIHRERAIKEGRCPRCGGILVERDGQFGRFYGCSNYPRCRFILK